MPTQVRSTTPDTPPRPDAGRESAAATLTPEQAQTLVLETIQHNAESLLRTARRHSLCADDAQEAYQRAMEIFLRRAATLDPARAAGWIHTVTKHEAMAVRRQRQQLVAAEEIDFDRHEARHLASPDERIVSFDQLTRSAEALQRLKPNELRALWMKASGQSYNAIAEAQGWTYTNASPSSAAKVTAAIAAQSRVSLATRAAANGRVTVTVTARAPGPVDLTISISDGRGHRLRRITRRVHLHRGRGTVTFHTTRRARHVSARATYAGSPTWLPGTASRTLALR